MSEENSQTETTATIKTVEPPVFDGKTPYVTARIILNGIETPVDVYVVSRDYFPPSPATANSEPVRVGPIRRFLRWIGLVW